MISIRFHGRGGHGMKTASRILGSAAFISGRHAQDSPIYGAERRGAAVAAFTRVSDAPILERGVIAHPDVIVVNAGAPQFTHGGSITMDAADVVSTAEVAPAGTVIAVHMEAYNHCGLTRAALAEACERAGCADRVLIPADGETIEIDLPR